MTSRITALFVVLALVAAACGGGADAEPAAEAETDEPEPTAEAETPSQDEPPAVSEDEPAVELADSFRGVTADSIKIGYPFIDFATLNADYGLELTFVDSDVYMQAMVDDLNARGGILGRTIDLVTVPYIPVGPVTADEACVSLTQDEEVFAVLSGFAGPGAEDVNVCITGLNDTILVGGVPNDERLAASTAPWVSSAMNSSRRGRAFVEVFAETGYLDELGEVAVLAVDPDQEATAIDVEEALIDAGVEVRVRDTIISSGDLVATQSETDVFLELARIEGATSIVLVGVNPNVSDKILEFGDEFVLAIVDAEQAQDLDHDTLDAGDRILGSATLPDPDDPATQRCVDIAESALDIDVRPPLELTEDEPNYWSATTGSCRTLLLFEVIATEAGADLTNESFGAAIGTVELPPLPGYPFASLGPDKVDARDSLSVVEWDFDVDSFVAVSEAVNVAAG